MKINFLVFFFSIFSLSLLAENNGLTLYADDRSNEKLPYFGVALGVSASTNGLGININTAITKNLSFRIGYESINKTFNNVYTYSIQDQSLTFSPTWQSGGISALADFYLFKRLYISGGAIYSNMNLACTVNSGNSIKMGDITFEPDEIGNLNLTIEPLNRLSPYGALGFGSNVSRDKRLALSFELGTYYMRSYLVGLSGTNLLSENGPGNQEALDKLNETLKTISWSGFYPVVKFGLSYKFYGKMRKQ